MPANRRRNRFNAAISDRTTLAALFAAGLLATGGLAIHQLTDRPQKASPPTVAAAPQPMVTVAELTPTAAMRSVGEAVSNVGEAVSSGAVYVGAWVRDAAPERHIRTIAVSKGDTLHKLLTAFGVAPQESAEAIDALRLKYDPRRLQLGQEITLTLEQIDGEAVRLAALALPESVERTVTVVRAEHGFIAEEILRELDRAPARVSGVISSSLYEAAVEGGLPMAVLTELIRMFSYDVDFQREIQPGDRFEVFYDEMLDADGRAVKAGAILAASLTLSGEPLRLYRFQPRDGDTDYFDPRGRNNRKALLRTPIDGARLSSGFGMRRHPVLGFSRMHRGVDFAAPAGTPIQAAGDGVVEMAGTNGGYGNYVRIRHQGQYATAYGHMSRITVRAGQRVRQGQVIGYVGSTGVSTGPHLHYETLLNGEQINPLSIKLPSGRSLEGRDLALFRDQVAAMEARIAATPTRTLLTANR